MADFAPGTLVMVKRRAHVVVSVVRKVPDTTLYETKTREGIIRHFWAGELEEASAGAKLNVVAEFNPQKTPGIADRTKFRTHDQAFRKNAG